MSNINSCHAFSQDVMGDMDATELALQIKQGNISAEEVAQAAINRVHQVNDKINAVALEDYRPAQQKASGLKEGFFAGVPTFIKDNVDLKGLPTNHGSAALNARPAKKNDPYMEQYLAQGFNVLGKSTLCEFGLSATCEPLHDEPTRNPWNLDYSTGASSAGSAALVAAGAVPIAHANDGGGSIRIPAACCGLVGLKPSRGRHIFNHQCEQLPIKLIGDGVVTRSVRDTARFHAEAEKFYRNKKLPEIGLVEGPSNRKLRIGVIVDSVTGIPTDDITRNAINKTVKLLEGMGHEVVESGLPVTQQFIEDFTVYYGMLAFATHRAGKLAVDPSFDASKVDGLTRGLSSTFAKKFYKIPTVLYRLRKSYQDYADFLNRGQLDVLLSPVLAQSTHKLGFLSPEVPFEELFPRLMSYAAFTPLNNANGSPSMSLPVGLTDNNLPVSLMFSANHGDERTLLELAYAIEAEQPWLNLNQITASTQASATKTQEKQPESIS